MFSVLNRSVDKVCLDDVVFHDSVDLEFFAPWYLCQIFEYDHVHDCTLSSIKLVSSLNSLSSICHYYQIDKVYLVSPYYLNKSEVWMLDVLDSIWVGKHESEEGIIDIYKYVLDSKKCLIHHHSDIIDIESQVNFELVINFHEIKTNQQNV